MVIIFIIAFILLWYAGFMIFGENMYLGFAFAVVVCIVVIALQCQEDKEKETKRLPNNDELEKQIYNGLNDDWKVHKTNGNHFVPTAYVGYMEKCSFDNDAWEVWAKARTKEIMIQKGYQPQSMSCVSEYDEVTHRRIDYSETYELYKQFNKYYLPLIEFYNEYGEYVAKLEELPLNRMKKEYEKRGALNEFMINGNSNSQYCGTSETTNYNIVFPKWICSKCGKEHFATEFKCSCGTSKYQSIEQEMLNDVEVKFGKKARDEWQKICESKASYSGRLSMLNEYYPIYELLVESLKFDNPEDGFKYITNNMNVKYTPTHTYYDESRSESISKEQALKNFCINIIIDDFDYTCKLKTTKAVF